MQMLTIADSARLTGKHPDTIRRLIKRLLKEDDKAQDNIKQELVNGGFSYRISQDYLLGNLQTHSATIERFPQEHMHTDMHTKFADGQQIPQGNLHQSKQPHRGMHTDMQSNSMQSPYADTQLLRETVAILKEQLRQKDEQIRQLLERGRETNVLLKGYQDRYLLEAPKEQKAGKIIQTAENKSQEITTAKRTVAKPISHKPQKFTAKKAEQPKKKEKPRKKGFFSWLR